MITFEQYKWAADRVRTGRGRAGDHEVCDAWDAQQADLARKRAAASPTREPRWYDLPIAARMWAGDARDTEGA